jgi:hypothetical protein
MNVLYCQAPCRHVRLLLLRLLLLLLLLLPRLLLLLLLLLCRLPLLFLLLLFDFYRLPDVALYSCLRCLQRLQQGLLLAALNG